MHHLTGKFNTHHLFHSVDDGDLTLAAEVHGFPSTFTVWVTDDNRYLAARVPSDHAPFEPQLDVHEWYSNTSHEAFRAAVTWATDEAIKEMKVALG